MFGFLLNKIVGSQSERTLKRFKPLVDRINGLEGTVSSLSDDELKGKTREFKERIAKSAAAYQDALGDLERQLGEVAIPQEKQKIKVKIRDINNKILEDVLPEAFAVVREAARRTIGLRHYDVQLMGAMTLHYGMIAEMSNGEGKTLVATLTAYLNALRGRGVHVVTVNDYLARRDRYWMGPVYEFLGLSVGVIQNDMDDEERQKAYNCDITYGTNNEFGFDYLRDNMKFRREQMVQREFHYAIVDEVDSILIDEARTPLIISGPAEEATDKYYQADKIARKLKGKKITDKEEIEAKYRDIDLTAGFDFIIKEKEHLVYLTEEGEKKAAGMWGVDNLNTIETMPLKHLTQQALRAHSVLFQRDVNYIVKEGQVIIVDEFTGRLMPGRRWSDGLHQAVEAKEGAKIERENQTLATVTFQNYFRMYEKLAGMTGTGSTEAAEFGHIYSLDIVTIPNNRPPVRQDLADVIYKTEKEKFRSVVEEVVESRKKGRPVLVGTISIEKSEHLSDLLKQRGIPHNVLNAKYHEMEAHIVAQAGRINAVTIATNMAGRGTDIRLGGNAEFMADDILRQKKIGPHDAGYHEERKGLLDVLIPKVSAEREKVLELGGLYVLGTERHESRRIDNQLRGRSGRQGVAGASRFYLSLEDDLMRIFASERISRVMDFFKWEESVPIEHALITRSIETAQKRVEGHNFEIRKQLLQYDNVMNRQREVIYDERRRVLESARLKEHIFEMIDEMLEAIFGLYANEGIPAEEWNLVGLKNHIRSKFFLEMEDFPAGRPIGQMRQDVRDKIYAAYEQKELAFGREKLEHIAHIILLQVIDAKWKDHLYNMDFLREGIGLRGYGGHDPLVEYQREGYDMFSRMVESIKDEALEFIFKARPVKEERVSGVFAQIPQQFLHPESAKVKDLPSQKEKPLPEAPPRPATEAPRPFKREKDKIGRNQPCPCGSGKKYKKCCGRDS
ncbi:MAG: preprotein translocase subunit SecA [Candidatus Omnitrophota bacterium]|nr:MAG: preprotein translocase subunit SecA [Candidatus Omnitrophota bacterium]